MLIVNGDDFGLAPGVNEGILESHRNGILTSASLMANGAAFEHAVELSRRAPDLGVGIHVNLTQGRPVSPPSAVPSLVNSRGDFAWTPAQLWRKVAIRRVNEEDIEREVRAQIEKILEEGIFLTHVDSHKHIHNFPGLSRIIIRLAREYKIRGFRCAAKSPTGLLITIQRNPWAAGRIAKQHFKGCALALVSTNREILQAGLATASHFAGLIETGYLDTGALRHIIARLPEGSTELMCHPGYVDETLEKTPTRLLREREREVEALQDPDIQKLVRDRSVRLINYRHFLGHQEAAGKEGTGRLGDGPVEGMKAE